jgi:hypothetical protein
MGMDSGLSKLWSSHNTSFSTLKGLLTMAIPLKKITVISYTHQLSTFPPTTTKYTTNWLARYAITVIILPANTR